MLEALKRLEEELKENYTFKGLYSGIGNDVPEQLKHLLELSQNQLSSYSFNKIVRNRLFLKDIDRDFKPVNAEYAKGFTDHKPARMACQIKLPIKTVLAALCSELYTGKERLIPITTGEPTMGPYTPGILAGDYLFLSGQIGDVNPETGRVVGTINNQLLRAMDKSKNLFYYHGYFKRDDVILIECYHTKNSEGEVLGKIIRRNYPQAEVLPTLVEKLPVGAEVELVFTARKRR